MNRKLFSLLCEKCQEKVQPDHEEKLNLRREYWKRYYKEHRDTLLARATRYYKENKEKRMTRDNLVYTCEPCNKPIKRSSKTSHIRSKLHKRNEREQTRPPRPPSLLGWETTFTLTAPVSPS